MKEVHKHPIIHGHKTFGQKAADKIATFGGSWYFISFFLIFLAGWMIMNAYFLASNPVDPFPFILLNLMLSTLAALQAPVILMAQNRQAERDRLHAHYDYQVNRKAEREIQELKHDVDKILKILETKR